MDVENKKLEVLLDQTDQAFKRLLDDPSSGELNHAYENAKSALDDYLLNMRELFEKRYKGF